ncbi:leucine-rich repeat domain-containing protein [Ruminococcaceae bacterium OttesenSCG-928-D13]|nr:leucine-rich repeat domain-containing protein [Ruminococcaceae bacterium OttesenSCG-928-D13]
MSKRKTPPEGMNLQPPYVSTLHCPACQKEIALRGKSLPSATVECEWCGCNFTYKSENDASGNIHFTNVVYNDVTYVNNTTVNYTDVDYIPINVNTTARPNRPRGRGAVTLAVAIVVLLVFIGGAFLLQQLTGIFDGSAHTAQVSESYRTMPESPDIKTFLSYAFSKPEDELTVEDITSIRYLEIGEADRHSTSDYWTFRYSFSDWAAQPDIFDETIHTIYIPRTITQSIEWQDMQCFTGLTRLVLNSTSIAGSSSGATLLPLTELTWYGGAPNQDATEIAKIVADPAAIQCLTTGLRTAEDTVALKQFTSLKHLRVAYLFEEALPTISALGEINTLTSLDLNSSTGDVAWLSSLTTLEKLRLDGGTSLRDFSVLHGMPALKELELVYASNLKDIAFVTSMPKLEKLSIDYGKITTLEPLRNKTSLRTLSIDGCSELRDLEALATLSSLQELYFRCFSGAAAPSLQNLTQLNTVYVNSNYFDMVADHTTLKELTVEGDADCPLTARLPSLHTLRVVDGDLLEPDALAGAQGLTSLSLNDVSLWREESAAAVFNLQNLKALEITDSSITIDFSTITTPPQLTSFSSIGCSWNYSENGSVVRTDAGIDEFTSLLGEMTSLKTLVISDTLLSSLSPFENLTQLEELDISNTYVTDIAPLTGHGKLKVLYCIDTPIQNLALLPETVLVNP